MVRIIVQTNKFLIVRVMRAGDLMVTKISFAAIHMRFGVGNGSTKRPTA